jgi:DNA processing protein
MAGMVKITDSAYPKLLKNIPAPPPALYFKGNLCKEIFDNCIAVVGSRNMSLYGKRVVEKILSVFSKEITVVSGFMTGVDAEAHRQAMKFGLSTIAVMPCGVDYIHPEEQEDLYDEIISGNGLIISEYEGIFKPRIWTYPKRNRIVSGLSRAVIVIEAAKNSGSLITARFAHSYGREVFVVPGSIFSNLSSGKVQIANEFAKLLDSGSYINKILGLGLEKNCRVVLLDGKNNSILNTLNDMPMTIDELSECLSTDVSNLSTQLTLLSMDGLVKEQGGRFYAC